MQKAQLLHQLQTERDNWEHVLNFVGSMRLGIGGVTGRWSVRDIVAHVMMREQYLADRLHEIQHNEPQPACKTQDELETFLADFDYPDFESPLLSEHAANEWVVQKYKNTPFKDLVVIELQAYDAIYESVKALSEEQLARHGLFDRVFHYTIDHYRQYTADIHKHFKAPLKH